MAEFADAVCLLLGDIDRGGVFASFLGTLELMDPGERARVRGLVINKFRGDLSLLRPGVEFIERRVGKPCLGVVPYLPDVGLDEEDGVAMEDRRTVPRVWKQEEGPERALRVGVVAFPYLANFTDFDSLAAEPSVALAYLSRPEELERADLLILPGSKQTLDDLVWLRREWFPDAIARHVARGGLTLGVCGGMQVLGREVSDPEGMEGGGSAPGLGLLPIRTVLAREKVTRRAEARLIRPQLFGRPMSVAGLQGYEIHLGVTECEPGAEPLFELRRAGSPVPVPDGATSADERVIATYLHGLFDSDRFRHAFLTAARSARGLSPPAVLASFGAERGARFDRLAEHVRSALDLVAVRAWLGLGRPR
jgi:adenosylcobyric acid synthase